MKGRCIVRELMDKSGVGVGMMMEKLHLKRSTMTERLRHDNLSEEKLTEMLFHLNYKLVAVPLDEKMKDGWYKLDNEVPEKYQKGKRDEEE